MKKTIVTIAALAAVSFSALSQGYVFFSASKSTVWDDFTTLGTPTTSAGTVELTFLWINSTTATVPWTQTATNATGSSATWSQINTLLSSGWNIATNASTSAQADVATGTGGTTRGNIPYGGTSSFLVAGTTAGANIDLVVIGWAATAGTTLQQADNANAALGVTAVINYATGATSSSPVNTLTVDGIGNFGVAPTPEPSTIALAGLGVSALVAFRRRNASK